MINKTNKNNNTKCRDQNQTDIVCKINYQKKKTAKQLLFYSHFEYDFRVTDKYE